MPSARIHELVARKVNEKYHMDDTLLRIGTVAPDSWRNTNEENKSKHKTHFWDFTIPEGEANDYKRFYQKYQEYMDNPFYFGYLIHLIVDQYWKTNIDPLYSIKIDGKKFFKLRNGTIKEDIDWYGYHESLKIQKQLAKRFNLTKLPIYQKDIQNFFCNIEELDLTGLFGENGSLNYINTQISPASNDEESEVFDIDEIMHYIDQTTSFVHEELNNLIVNKNNTY